MRLIDADKLPISFDGHTVSVWKNDIDNAPTIEAIPIEWLKKCGDSYILCCTIVDDIIEEWREENGKV